MRLLYYEYINLNFKTPNKKDKSNAGSNRDSWAYYQLEQFIQYKAQQLGIAVEKIPAPYTSKSCSKCGAIGSRNKHSFRCPVCHFKCHSADGVTTPSKFNQSKELREIVVKKNRSSLLTGV